MKQKLNSPKNTISLDSDTEEVNPLGFYMTSKLTNPPVIMKKALQSPVIGGGK